MKVFAHFSKISRYFTCFVASRTRLTYGGFDFASSQTFQNHFVNSQNHQSKNSSSRYVQPMVMPILIKYLNL